MPLQTADAALRTLELLAERETVGMREVAEALATSRSSAYRVVRTLVNRGWVVEAEFGRYELGPLALTLGLRALRQSSLREIALPWMRRLVAETQETVTLSLLVGSERVAIEQIESPREIRMSVKLGQRYPLYAGGSGRALLAALEPAVLAEYLQSVHLEPLAPNTILDRGRLEAVLSEATARGYVVSLAERDREAFAVASAIWGPGGVVGALAVCGPASRFAEADAHRYGVSVREAAHAVSQALGGNVPARTGAQQPDQGRRRSEPPESQRAGNDARAARLTRAPA